MERDDLILAALSTADGATYTPVQVQKLLFLIDRRIPRLVGGPHFNFEPYDYGPFDSTIYTELESLATIGLVEIISEPNLRWRKYRLTPEGVNRGIELLNQLDDEASTYIRALVNFVRRLSFAELVGAVYKAYPEMKVKSVFRD
jgi:hypothetical protein